MSIDIEAIRRRAEAATAGPWEKRPKSIGGRVYEIEIYSPRDSGHAFKPIMNIAAGFTDTDENAEFITHACEDIPALLTENATLTLALAEIREKIDNAQEMAIATHKSVCGCLDWRENVRCQAMYKIAAAFALAAATPTQQER